MTEKNAQLDQLQLPKEMQVFLELQENMTDVGTLYYYGSFMNFPLWCGFLKCKKVSVLLLPVKQLLLSYKNLPVII